MDCQKKKITPEEPVVEDQDNKKNGDLKTPEEYQTILYRI